MQNRWTTLLVIVALLALAIPALAQDTPPIPDNVDTSNISDDEVNEVAEKLYCPVCENIPLDACGTAACEDWRNEIRGMLAVDMSESEIIDNFVVRFGDRVVGTPQDPLLRAIALVVPWLVTIAGVFIAGWTLLQMRQKNTGNNESAFDQDDDAYLDMLERDVTG